MELIIICDIQSLGGDRVTGPGIFGSYIITLNLLKNVKYLPERKFTLIVFVTRTVKNYLTLDILRKQTLSHVRKQIRN